MGAEATLSIDTSPKIPADVHASVRSISAVGEQYVDLVPRSESPPYLRDGSVIAARDTSIPQPVGPMLDRLSALVNSIPKDKLSQLLDESFKSFNGAGYDLQTLLDSSAKISHDANDTAEHTRGFIDDAVPFLDAQAQTADATRRWAHNLAGVTEQLVTDDPQFRKLLQHRTWLLPRGFQAAQPVETHPAGIAGQPDDHRSNRRDLPPVAGATVGAAAPGCRGVQLLRRHQQPDRFGRRWIHPDDCRPAGMHGGIPAALAVALAGRHEGDGHS